MGGGGANKVKKQKSCNLAQGEGAGGGMPPPARSAEAKLFLQNPRSVREQIRVIFK